MWMQPLHLTEVGTRLVLSLVLCRRFTLSNGTSDVVIKNLILGISNTICNWKHWPSSSTLAKMHVTNNNKCVGQYERSCNEWLQLYAPSTHIAGIMYILVQYHPKCMSGVLKLELIFSLFTQRLQNMDLVHNGIWYFT